ncbi:heavy metal sensor histidine kinase [Acinetobacter calcoaceticus]|nr:heavy metal sensor histidine kinase [Acinetobacter calcoaceticus]
MRKISTNSIIFRICFSSIIFTIFTLSSMGFILNKVIVNHFYMQNKKQLQGKIQLVDNLLEQKSRNLKCNLDEALFGHDDITIQIKNTTNNKIIYKRSDYIIDKNNINFSKKNWGEWQINEVSYSGFIIQKKINQDGNILFYEIIAGIKNNNNFNFIYFFREKLLIIGLIGFFSLIFLIIFSTIHGLKPIKKMAELSKNIYINNLDSRLEISTMPIEIIPVAKSFNQMLDRIKLSVEKLSDFSSDLAHEIRTPINNITMQTQVCLNKPRDNNYYKEVLLSNLEELNKLTKLISDMLFIAKHQNTSPIANFKLINLKNLITDISDYFEPYSTEKKVLINIKGDASALIDPYIFSRALNNLIYNAIKYTRNNTIVEVELISENDKTVILIKNTVNSEIRNLSQQQLERFFDRFYRFDESRQSSGTGLGLAITKSIIEMHNGSISNYILNDTIIFKIVL